MGKLYDEKSIESLDPREFTRLRPQVYCGDTSYSTQLLIEIFSNALDEFNLNHGNEIQMNVVLQTLVKDLFLIRFAKMVSLYLKPRFLC